MFDILYWGDGSYERGYDRILRLILMFPHLKFKTLIRRKDPETPGEVILDSKIVILPYRWMAVRPPLTLVESMAYGACVVTSPLGGNEELILSGYNGLILDFDDLERVKEYILKVLESKTWREFMGRNAKKTIRELYEIGHI